MPKAAPPGDAEPLVTGEELAERLGISDRQVRALAERTVIRREAPNRYRLWPSILGYVSHLREQAAGRAALEEDGSKPDLVTEKALLARAQREGQNMKNAVLRGELLPIDDVEDVVGAVLDAVRSKITGLPTKAAPRLLGLKTLPEMRATLTGQVHDTLSDLSSVAVVVANAADRARRRIGRRAAGDTLDEEAEAPAEADGKPVG